MEVLMCALDLEKTPASFISYVENMARKLNAAVWLVHVAQPHPDVIDLPLERAKDWRNLAAKEGGLLPRHQVLLQYAEQMQAMGIEATPVLVQGPAVECLLEVARNVGATMILVNSHGHGPLYDMLVGSVAEGVTGGNVCPVLWVPDGWLKAERI